MTDFQFDIQVDEDEDGYDLDLVTTVDAGLQPFDHTVMCLICEERFLEPDKFFTIDPDADVCDRCIEQREEDRQLRSDYYRSVL